MKNIDNAKSFITNTLKDIFCGDYTDIPRVQLYFHYTESVLISLLNANRLGILNRDSEAYCMALNQMVELGLLSSEVPTFLNKHKKIIHDNLRLGDNNEWNNVHSIHEGLLSQELNISEKSVWFSSDKVSRDNTGAYYTPSNLALEVVREAVERYLEANNVKNKDEAQRMLLETNFADLSCGCGEFIKTIQVFLLKQYNIEPEKICLNLYGADIDPIALQITICDLLEIVSRNKWSEIIDHFVLGNPLISLSEEKSLAEKTRLFATKRFYASDMGINTNNLFANVHIGIVVGNPPWEKIRFEERKFFKPLIPKIAAISQKNKRQIAIGKLKNQDPVIYDWYRKIAGDYTSFKNVVKANPFLSTSLNGELNTFVLFTELSLNIIDNTGVFSLIVKSSIATSPVNKPLFTQLTNQKNLASICLYNNSLRIFDIDSRERFCVITCTKTTNSSFELIAGASRAEDLHTLERISLSTKHMSIINPYTHMLPNISKNADIQILLNVHKRLPLFDTVFPQCHFGRLVHLTSHAQNIDITPENDNVPIYEGKFIERYDARFATFSNLPNTQKYSAKAHAKKNVAIDGKKALPECRYFIHKDFWNKLKANYPEPFMLCWRSLTSPTNARTTLAMLLPTMPTSQSIQFLQTDSNFDILLMLALLNSKPFDYLVRLKMPGLDLTQSVIKQIPVPNRDIYLQRITYSKVNLPLERHIIERVLALISHEVMLSSILKDIMAPSLCVQKKSKTTLENELDDLFFVAYGFSVFESKEIRASFRK